MKKNKIQLALAVATAAFISVPVGGASPSSTGARDNRARVSGARTRGRVPARAGVRAGGRATKKRVSPRGLDTSPAGARQTKVRAGGRTNK